MKILSRIAIAAVIITLAVIGFAYSGLYDVSASSSHSGVVSWLLSTTSEASIERRAGAVDVPELDDETLVLAGINDFNSMCIGCHGAPGIEPEAMGQGLNPPAPDLAEEAAEMTPAELFWVTKHGISMTGMPAWGATHDDASLWPIVALMVKLPGLDESGYQSLLASAQGHGHHSDDSSAGQHSHGAVDEAPNNTAHEHGASEDHGGAPQPETVPEAAEEDDHSAHEHTH